MPPQLNCIVCCSSVSCDDHLFGFKEELSHISEVFVNYWVTMEGGKRLPRLSPDVFPFCKLCRSFVFKVHYLHLQTQEMLKIIKGIISNASAKLILACSDEEYKVDNKVLRADPDKCSSNAMGLLRSLILSRYRPTVVLSSVEQIVPAHLKIEAHKHAKSFSEIIIGKGDQSMLTEKDAHCIDAGVFSVSGSRIARAVKRDTQINRAVINGSNTEEFNDDLRRSRKAVSTLSAIEDHPFEWKCGVCDSLFETSSQLYNHLQILRQKKIEGDLNAKCMPPQVVVGVKKTKDNENEIFNEGCDEDAAYDLSSEGGSIHLDIVQTIRDAPCDEAADDHVSDNNTNLDATKTPQYKARNEAALQKTHSTPVPKIRKRRPKGWYKMGLTSPTAVESDMPFWSGVHPITFREAVEEISSGKYRYLGKYDVEVVENGHKCCTCGAVKPERKYILNHIRYFHAPYLPYKKNVRMIEIEPNRFQYGDLIVEKNEEEYSCMTCNHKTTDREAIMQHLRSRHLEEVVCETCGQQFGSSVLLRQHQYLHSKELNFICKHCDQRFKTRNLLRHHKQREHLGDEAKNFTCEYCGKRFWQVAELKAHKFHHTGVKEYQCSNCDKKYSSYKGLQVHSKKHTEQKRYACDLCQSTFSQTSGMLRHKRKIHKIDLPVQTRKRGDIS